ncbi:hypothetical protein [Rhizobium sp. PP-CC-3G-465]|uniref:hypothetical protein n=1 Tax=Rhizobium sp. PP-CC-3G-465 TaxID=2135648 RepID=UPI0010530D39
MQDDDAPVQTAPVVSGDAAAIGENAINWIRNEGMHSSATAEIRRVAMRIDLDVRLRGHFELTLQS